MTPREKTIARWAFLAGGLWGIANWMFWPWVWRVVGVTHA
jgi:hypothetical protein